MRRVVAASVVVLLVLAFVALGFWQLDRAAQRRDVNALIRSRSFQPLLTGIPHNADPAELEHRRVRLTGTYDREHELILRGRALNGRPGHHVLTPLLLPGGDAVLVNRGWVPLDLRGVRAETMRAPIGGIEIIGTLLPSETGGRIVAPEKLTGVPRSITSADVAAVDALVPYRLAPLYVLLQREIAQPHRLPRVVEVPTRSSGRHTFYAFQWFSFAAITLVGWAAVLRRARRPVEPR